MSATLFLRYVRSEMRAEVERACAARGITCCESNLTAWSEPFTWDEDTPRVEVVARARRWARYLVMLAPGGLVHFAIEERGPRSLLLCWAFSPRDGASAVSSRTVRAGE